MKKFEVKKCLLHGGNTAFCKKVFKSEFRVVNLQNLKHAVIFKMKKKCFEVSSKITANDAEQS